MDNTSDTTSQPDKSIFQHVFFIIAIAIIALVVAWRAYLLKRSGRPPGDFFNFSSSFANRRLPRTQSDVYNQPPDQFSPPFAYPSLSPLPVPHRTRRVRAADIDAGGRRLSPEDGEWDHKDELPAYDSIGGPPKYVEAELQASQARARAERNPFLSRPQSTSDQPALSLNDVPTGAIPVEQHQMEPTEDQRNPWSSSVVRGSSPTHQGDRPLVDA
ncbi:hypothetical protein SERLA73DRAFT_190771 [Serpula lacrymans var. lacrymans S7.3]|uniref:Uncharacterized protein n=1 Tax=Serpula lacrymans var. lacrymans (strain S7.3) TaxID=936435 RepID=F8QGC0_SERL3|nr:hypothetical protein SERLA73DRAFT_190771 [Serpula lacrymans var. lacrymans S7.3]